MDYAKRVEISVSNWKGLYKAGGVAALLAGILFRRNIAAEVSLFSPLGPPDRIQDWFTLLQNNRLLGLTYLHIFDLVNLVLVGLMFLALYIALRQVNQSAMLIAAALGFLGIAVYLASNTAFSMLSLSDQYAASPAEAERSMLLAAGQALLAANRFSAPGAHPGSGGLMSLLLIATACMVIAITMLRSGAFNRVTAVVGILASGLDLAYCTAFAFLPALDPALLALIFIPAAGLLWMVWHILVGLKLIQAGRHELA